VETDRAEEGWTTYVGQQVRVANTDTESERRREERVVEQMYDTRVWHKLAARPERFFQMPIPRLGMNAYMRQMVQGVDRSFNPQLYVLSQEGFKAIRRRDQWIRSTWPLFEEKAVPYENGGPFDRERMENEQVHMDQSNRIAGGLDALGAGDIEGGLAHFYDAYHVSTHTAADIEARRKAEDRKSDVLLRKRAALSQSGGVDGLMYALGKSELAQREFFRKGEGWRWYNPALQHQYHQWYNAPNPFTNPTYTTQFPYSGQYTNTFTTSSDYSQQYNQYNNDPSSSAYIPQGGAGYAGSVQTQPEFFRGRRRRGAFRGGIGVQNGGYQEQQQLPATQPAPVQSVAGQQVFRGNRGRGGFARGNRFATYPVPRGCGRAFGGGGMPIPTLPSVPNPQKPTR
jgi:hypothetical protein